MTIKMIYICFYKTEKVLYRSNKYYVWTLQPWHVFYVFESRIEKNKSTTTILPSSIKIYPAKLSQQSKLSYMHDWKSLIITAFNVMHWLKMRCKRADLRIVWRWFTLRTFVYAFKSISKWGLWSFIWVEDIRKNNWGRYRKVNSKPCIERQIEKEKQREA